VERLKDKVAISVGCATGMGAASARLMAQEGAKVVLADINPTGAEKTAAQIQEAGGEAIVCYTDIGQEDTVVEMVKTAVETYGRIDVLHNNAAAVGHGDGMSGASNEILADDLTDALNLDLKVWDRTLAINLTGFLFTCRHVVPHMVKQGQGSIVNISSAAALKTRTTGGAYSVSKAGVEALTHHIATAYGKQGIRCNAIAPGSIVGPERTARMQQEQYEKRLRHYPSPRLGKPEDIGWTVVFLVSDEAAFINGQVIFVDGGWLIHTPNFVDGTSGVW
jgi:NAD(P)-dependent dehydrogenase (short-subunit alcohol dehydrogenase family)